MEFIKILSSFFVQDDKRYTIYCYNPKKGEEEIYFLDIFFYYGYCLPKHIFNYLQKKYAVLDFCSVVLFKEENVLFFSKSKVEDPIILQNDIFSNLSFLEKNKFIFSFFKNQDVLFEFSVINKRKIIKKIYPSPKKIHIQNKKLFFDIEVNIKKNKVILIYATAFTDDIEVNSKIFKGSEKEIINSFSLFLEEFKPHYICGYNHTTYDNSFLTRLFIREKLFFVYFEGQKEKFFFDSAPWFVHIDIYHTLKKLLQERKYSLAAMSEKYLQEEKNKIDLSSNLSNGTVSQELIDYCIKDVYLTKKLDDKFKISSFLNKISSIRSAQYLSSFSYWFKENIALPFYKACFLQNEQIFINLTPIFFFKNSSVDGCKYVCKFILFILSELKTLKKIQILSTLISTKVRESNVTIHSFFEFFYSDVESLLFKNLSQIEISFVRTFLRQKIDSRKNPVIILKNNIFSVNKIHSIAKKIKKFYFIRQKQEAIWIDKLGKIQFSNQLFFRVPDCILFNDAIDKISKFCLNKKNCSSIDISFFEEKYVSNLRRKISAEQICFKKIIDDTLKIKNENTKYGQIKKLYSFEKKEMSLGDTLIWFVKLKPNKKIEYTLSLEKGDTKELDLSYYFLKISEIFSKFKQDINN